MKADRKPGSEKMDRLEEGLPGSRKDGGSEVQALRSAHRSELTASDPAARLPVMHCKSGVWTVRGTPGTAGHPPVLVKERLTRRRGSRSSSWTDEVWAQTATVLARVRLQRALWENSWVKNLRMLNMLIYRKGKKAVSREKAERK